MTLATPDDVAHLFGRAAFGATRADLARWTGVEYDHVVDALFPPATRTAEPDEARRVELERNANHRFDITPAQRWWLERMRSASCPLEERMTWFWHTHFATAYTGSPTSNDMLVQNQTIRRNALGSFRTLTEELTVDVAMLYWLSGNTNRVRAVNENYARELFELFVAGTIPQRYDESVVREAARALTGWYVNSERKALFASNNHDRGTKVLGTRVIGGYPAGDPREATEYKEVVDYALSLDSAARFVAYKLVSSFAYIPASTDLVADPDPLVADVAAAFGPGWSITNALKTLLKHPRFRDPAQASVLRSPVETTVHLCKVLGVDIEPPGVLLQPNTADNNRPIYALRRMAQMPFEPPNVAGWPKGARAVSATTTLGRYSLPVHLDVAAQKQSAYAVTPLPASGDLAGWTSFVGLGHLDPLTRQQVQAYLANPGTTNEASKQVAVLVLLTTSPQWQVV